VYLGTHIGSAWSDPSISFSDVPGQSFSPMASGLVWGGHLGVNYQFHGVLLVGAEVGYAGNWLSAMATAPLPSTSLSGISANDLFTVTGRFGYVFHDNYLFYGKAGYASSLMELNAASTGVTAHVQERENGWLLGAGVESRIISNILFGVEYNYIGFSSDHLGTAVGSPPSPNVDVGNLHMQTFVARLSILFGPNCCSEGVLGKY
jgi:opacity protein-like surface antigen